MPTITLLLTLLGLVPFFACGLAALGHNPDPADRMLTVLIDYAALVLAFAGAVHWGLALAPAEVMTRTNRLRMGLAVLPLVAGWIALVLNRTLAPWMALTVLILGYVVTVVVETQAGRLGLVPSFYLWTRWGFSIVAVAMLTTVLTLRLLGQTIVF